MDRLVNNLRVLWRTERAIAEIKLRHALARFGLNFAAGMLALIGLVMPLASRSRRDRRALWPLVWLGSTIIVFTFVPMKKNVYLLPAMPAQTLLIAAAITSSLRLPRAARLLRPERFLYIAHALGAIVGRALADPERGLAGGARLTDEGRATLLDLAGGDARQAVPMLLVGSGVVQE